MDCGWTYCCYSVIYWLMLITNVIISSSSGDGGLGLVVVAVVTSWYYAFTIRILLLPLLSHDWLIQKDFLLTKLMLLTSNVMSPGSSLISSDRCVSWLDESNSLVRSVCSHQWSDWLKDTFCWASSGMSVFRLYTLCGTEIYVKRINTKQKMFLWVLWAYMIFCSFALCLMPACEMCVKSSNYVGIEQ